MYNDESSQSSQEHGAGFVRRPIPKYNGDKSGGEYQQQDQQTSSPPPQRSYSSGGGYRSGGYNRDRQGDGPQSSYSGSAQRGRRPEGGGSGGYGERSGGYRSGGSGGGYGYNRGGGGYGSNDRVAKQNDIIIQLLREIRDRLPAPPEGASSSKTSGSSSYGPSDSESYSSGYRSSGHGYTSYKTSRPASVSSDSDDSGEFEVSGGNAGSSATPGGGGDAEDEFNN